MTLFSVTVIEVYNVEAEDSQEAAEIASDIIGCVTPDYGPDFDVEVARL